MSSKAAMKLGKSPAAGKRPKGVVSSTPQKANSGAVDADSSTSVPPVLLLRTFLRLVEDGQTPSDEQLHQAMKGRISEDVTSKQIGSRFRNLKWRFFQPKYRSSSQDPVYILCEKIWGAKADPRVSEALFLRATPTAKRQSEKTPDLVAYEEEEERGRSRRARRGHNAAITPARKPATKKKAPDVDAETEDDVDAETEDDADEDGPVKYTTPAPKRKSKETPGVAAAKVVQEAAGNVNNTTRKLPLNKGKAPVASSEIKEGDNVLSGLVNVLKQVYPEVDEMAVLPALNRMDPPRMQEMKNKWQDLRSLKLDVASLTAELGMAVAQALQQRLAS